MKWFGIAMYGLAGLAVIALAVAAECYFIYLFVCSVVISSYH